MSKVQSDWRGECLSFFSIKFSMTKYKTMDGPCLPCCCPPPPSGTHSQLNIHGCADLPSVKSPLKTRAATIGPRNRLRRQHKFVDAWIETLCLVVVIVNWWLLKSHSGYMLIRTCSAVLGAEGGSVARCLHPAKDRRRRTASSLERLETSDPKFLKFHRNILIHLFKNVCCQSYNSITLVWRFRQVKLKRSPE